MDSCLCAVLEIVHLPSPTATMKKMKQRLIFYYYLLFVSSPCQKNILSADAKNLHVREWNCNCQLYCPTVMSI